MNFDSPLTVPKVVSADPINDFQSELHSLKFQNWQNASVSQLYQRPGQIKNIGLLQKGNCLKLIPNLMEHYDYEAVS